MVSMVGVFRHESRFWSYKTNISINHLMIIWLHHSVLIKDGNIGKISSTMYIHWQTEDEREKVIGRSWSHLAGSFSHLVWAKAVNSLHYISSSIEVTCLNDIWYQVQSWWLNWAVKLLLSLSGSFSGVFRKVSRSYWYSKVKSAV